MATALLPLLGRLGANLQPPPNTVDYDGLEYKWRVFVFRPALFQKEAIALVVLGLMIAAYMFGKEINESKVKSWWKQFDPRFALQFKALSPLPTQPLVSNSPSTYMYYLTGRRSVLSFHIIFNLIPRHNLVQTVQDLVWSLVDPNQPWGDELVLDFTLSQGPMGQQGEGPGVWGVVRKSGVMNSIRKERWDTTFTKTITNDKLPATHVILTEHAECTEYLLNAPNVGLLEVLKNENCAGILKSLIITDQPSTRPSTGALPEDKKSRHVIITLNLPAKGREEESFPWVQVGLNLCDYMNKVALKPETSRKLKKTRQEVSDELNKSYLEEQKEELGDPEEEKRAAKRKEEARRRAAMPEAERKKLEEKEKKRELKKQQLRQMKGGK